LSSSFIAGVIGARIIIVAHYFVENAKTVGAVIVGAEIIVVADDGLGDAATRGSIAVVGGTVIVIVTHNRTIFTTL
jgi:hypothetical protein